MQFILASSAKQLSLLICDLLYPNASTNIPLEYKPLILAVLKHFLAVLKHFPKNSVGGSFIPKGIKEE